MNSNSVRYPCLSDLKVEFKPGDRFECIIGPKSGLKNALLHAVERGMYMDSSWRNKNAFRCPMTILSTINEFHRMIPSRFDSSYSSINRADGEVAVMVSNTATEQMYTLFLQTILNSVNQLASELVGEFSNRDEGMDKDTQELLYLRALAVAGDDGEGFCPAFMMIDHSAAERNAIRTVFPGLPIRLCQFHFMQACKSNGQTAFPRDIQGTTQLNMYMKALRKAQRCPTEADWPKYFKALEADVNAIAWDDGAAWRKIGTYLSKYWFDDSWRPYCVDYGIPPHYNRDGPWSTNNYAEVAFRVFDRTFLSCRVNKRQVEKIFWTCSAG